MSAGDRVIQVVDGIEKDVFLMTRTARNVIGKALGRAYPDHIWHVAVTHDGTAAQITCPNITARFGFHIHLNQPAITLEQKAVKFGGELLERFNVSREIPDFSHITRKINGEAVGAERGEL